MTIPVVKRRAMELVRRQEWVTVGSDAFGMPLRICPECRALDGVGARGQHAAACKLRSFLDDAGLLFDSQSGSDSSGSSGDGFSHPANRKNVVPPIRFDTPPTPFSPVPVSHKVEICVHPCFRSRSRSAHPPVLLRQIH